MPSVVAGIWLKGNWLDCWTYNIQTKEITSDYKVYQNGFVEGYINVARRVYGTALKKVVIYDPSELLNKSDYRDEYDDLLYFATKGEMVFEYYFPPLVRFAVNDWILVFLQNNHVHLYQCKEISEWVLTLREVKRKWLGKSQEFTLESVVKDFGMQANQIHIAIDKRIKKEFYPDTANFLSVVYIESCLPTILIARMLVGDPHIQYLVKYVYEQEKKTNNIENCDIIYIPEVVSEYAATTDIMGIDLGSTRCVLAVSKNTGIQIIPFDSSSSENPWTESVVSFDAEEPIFGKAAARRLRTKPSYVLFDMKLLVSESYKYIRGNWVNDVWPFKVVVKNNHEVYFKTENRNDKKEFTCAEFNAIFLRKMKEKATDFQSIFNNKVAVREAVITVPRYFKLLWDNKPLELETWVKSIIEAAKMVDIKIIDIIEETHADLLYYLSHEKYSNMVKAGMKIAVFDIGGGAGICRIYEINQNDKFPKTDRKVAVFQGFIDCKTFGRQIDQEIMREIEHLLRTEYDIMVTDKLKLLEKSKQIKHELSSKDTSFFNIAEFDPETKERIKFTRKWLEDYLRFDCYYFPGENNSTKPSSEKRDSIREECKDFRLLNNQNQVKDINFVLLAGGTCKIPFIQGKIKDLFPKAELIIDRELEIITAKGAAIHAIQVRNREVRPYVGLDDFQ